MFIQSVLSDRTRALSGSAIACRTRVNSCDTASCSWKAGPQRLTHASHTCMQTRKS